MKNKLFKIAFLRIRTYYFTDKLVLGLFLLGNLFSILSLIFFYGNFSLTKVNTAENKLEYRTYIVDFQKSHSTDDIFNIFDDSFEVQDIEIKTVSDTHYEDLPKKHEIYEDLEPINLVALYNNNNGIYSEKNRLSFSDDESLKNSLIVTNYFYELERLEFFGENYEVVRVASHYPDLDFFVPVGKLIDINKVDQIKYYFADIPTKSENLEIIKMLDDKFEGIIISDPYKNILADMDNQMNLLLPLLIVFGISIISYLFLYRYLIDKNALENVIYFYVGAIKKDILFVMVIELCILSLASSILAIFTHILLYDLVFSKLNLTQNLVYTNFDYLIITALVFTLTLLISLFFIISTFVVSPVKLRRKFN